MRIFAILLSGVVFPVMSLAAEAPKPTIVEQLMPFAFIFLIFYFLVIRPQGKKYKRHIDFLSKIKKGDEVLTASGILGKVEGITNQFVTLEVAQGVKIKVVKSQVQSHYEKEAQGSVQLKTNSKTLAKTHR